jgi:uncharacterized protein
VRQRLRVVVVAAALLGWSALAPRVPARWHPLPHVLIGAALAAATRAPLGLSPPTVATGLRRGALVAGAVSVAVAGSTAIAPVRAAMAARELPSPVARWLLVRIPFGTVWSEEAGYRAALGSLAARAFGVSRGRYVGAAVFGLSHIPDARAAGESVPGTVLVTGVAGWLFGWLYDSTGSLAAPMLAHLAVNEAGAVAALAVRARD